MSIMWLWVCTDNLHLHLQWFKGSVEDLLHDGLANWTASGVGQQISLPILFFPPTNMPS
jgi:hypothetical protein